MYQAYESELYRFDQLYRHFCEAADLVEANKFDILKQLRPEFEKCYVNWYLTTLAMAWGKFIDAGLLAKWRIDRVPNQHEFYNRNVKPWIAEADNRRAFVIISDAFRWPRGRPPGSRYSDKGSAAAAHPTIRACRSRSAPRAGSRLP